MEPKPGQVPMVSNSIFGPACRIGGILVVAQAPGPAWSQLFRAQIKWPRACLCVSGRRIETGKWGHSEHTISGR
jgi:hypothetical protein